MVDVRTRLEVTVHDAPAVEVVDGEDELLENLAGLLLAEGSLGVESVEQVAVGGVLEDEEDVGVGLHLAHNLADVLVVDLAHDAALALGAVVNLSALLGLQILLDDLHRYVGARGRQAAPVDRRATAAAHLLANHHRLLVHGHLVCSVWLKMKDEDGRRRK